MNEMNRRTFLGQSAALAAAATLPGTVIAQEKMRTRLIPGTDETLPVVGLGAPRMFIELPPEGKDLPKAAIQAMVDLGGTLMDTPAFFRPDVPVLYDILAEMGLKDDLFLTSKITVDGKEEGIAHLEKVVSGLNKRPMDLLFIHNMRQMDVHWPTLKDWKEAGRVRYIGVSRTRQQTYDGLEKFMKAEKPDFIMTGYSMFHPEAEERILPLAADMGIAVVGVETFKGTEDGSFFNVVGGKELPDWTAEFDCETWAHYAIKYVLSNPAMTALVTETSKVEHVIDNMRAGYGRLPDEAMRQRMKAHLLSL
jgi:diketogulonate reductase-like aldo/keto reductase